MERLVSGDPRRSRVRRVGEIAIVRRAGGWHRIGALAAPVRAAARRALVRAMPATLGRRPVALTIALTDDAEMRVLNGGYRGKDAPTNVLAFPVAGAAAAAPTLPLHLGDVVLGYETLAREASDLGRPALHHLQHLVVHGVLHLLGHDHIGAGEAQAMEALETAVLSELGIPDPYDHS